MKGTTEGSIDNYLRSFTFYSYMRSEQPLPPHLRERKELKLYEIFIRRVKSMINPEENRYREHPHIY